MTNLGVRLSLRVLRRHAKLSLIAVLSLAIGLAAAFIGLCTYGAVLMRPPAVPEPDQLLTVYTVTPDHPFNELSYPDYVELRDHNHVFSGLAAIPFSISADTTLFEGRSKSSLANAVSDNYFQVLGVSLLLGPGFAAGDDAKVTRSAVLSYPYWQWLGRDPHVLGKVVTVNGLALTIVGVAPAGFLGTIISDLPDVWYPLSAFHDASDDWRTRRQDTPYSLIGRLRPDVTPSQALAELQTISRQIAVAHPETNKDRVAAVTSISMLPPDSVADAKLLCTLILAVVGLVLLAACTNVLNLLLALSSLRRQEFLIRAALGAGRARLIGQLLVDAAILATTGGLLGFGLAAFGLRRLMDFKPYLPGIGVIAITLDFRPTLSVGAVMVVLVCIVACALGLLPGLEASRADVADALRGEVVIGGARKSRVRNLLVGAQLFACTMVLIGVGLCLQSLSNLRRLDLGYAPQNVAILNLADGEASRSDGARRALFDRVRQTVSEAGGIDSVSLTAMTIPLTGGPPTEVTIGPGGSTQVASVSQGVVDGAYFSTLRVPVLEGRVFAATDLPTSPEVVVINRTMAQRFWRGSDPVGGTVVVNDGHRRVIVVGVVADSRYSDIDEPPTPVMYFALSQHQTAELSLLARTRSDARAALLPLAQSVGKLDAQLAATPFTTLQDWTNFAFYPARLALACVSGFGLLAAVLTAVGLYGAVFYSVSARTREFGVRVALGAAPRDLLTMILRHVAAVSAAGIVLGLGVGIGGTALVASWLYGIRPVEWTVLAGVALAMMTMTLLMAYSAARPWLRVDPLRAVRHI
jgi:macrolide transport system ATP-binding/permease protein